MLSHDKLRIFSDVGQRDMDSPMQGNIFQGGVGGAKIPMPAISNIGKLKPLTRELVDEKSFQLASYALPMH